MKLRLSLLLSIVYCALSQSILSQPVTAQVTTDGTTNSSVEVSGNDFTIENGDRAGGNLFHSFSDFSVPTDGSAFFNNAADIVNIFSRVTGGNISNIDGLLSANGSANLFLLNPAGILFGAGARLDIGGSFFGTTADSIIFSDGEFSATDLDNPPLLTINAPIGLNFRDNPGEIVNRSDLAETEIIDEGTDSETLSVTRIGLEVDPGNNLTLIGGDVSLENSGLTAPGGRIELGGLSAAGTVTINLDGSLSFPEGLALADLSIANASNVDVSGIGSGSIIINARNLDLDAGDLGSSNIRAGITENTTGTNDQVGAITINVRDQITIDNESRILNRVDSGAVGNSGDINITTNSLEADNNSRIVLENRGIGNTGNININADSILFKERDTGIRNEIAIGGVGNTGNIKITTNNLTVQDDAVIVNQIDNDGQGTAGTITIVANESIELIDGKIDNEIDEGTVGGAGNIEITTPSLSLEDNARIRSRTLGQGNAGDIIINVANTIDLDDSNIQSEVDRSNRENVEGTELVNNDAIGNAGTITLTTRELNLTNDSRITTTSFSRGNAGDITINASESVFLDDSIIRSNLNDLSRGFFDAVGDGGNLTVNTQELTLTNESRLDASTSGIGTVGSVIIDANEVNLEQKSFILSQIRAEGAAAGGRIQIDADNISLKEFSFLSTNTTSSNSSVPGDAGNIILNADTISITEGAIVDALTENNSNGGNVIITARVLDLATGGKVVTSTDGAGNAGVINLTISDRINLDGSNPSLEDPVIFNEAILNRLRPNTGLFVSTSDESIGDGGGVSVNTNTLSLANQAQISAETLGAGNAGEIEITANSLNLASGAEIITDTSGSGNAGNILVTANDSVNIAGENSGIFATTSSDSTGNGGNITIGIFDAAGNLDPTRFTKDIILSNQGTITADSEGMGSGGAITIRTEDLNLDSGNISATTAFPQQGTNPSLSVINLFVDDNLILRNNSTISAEATNSADGGNININAGFIIGFPSRGLGSDIRANAEAGGQGGKININVNGVLGFEESRLTANLLNNTNDIDASSETTGLDGVVTINNPDVNPLQGTTRLPINIVSADTITTDACSPTGEGNSLIFEGRGGVSPQPIAPLSAEALIPDGKPIEVDQESDLTSLLEEENENSPGNSHYSSEDIQPVKTSIGDIYPARGVIKTDDGKIILTAYATDKLNTRTPEIAANCDLVEDEPAENTTWQN